MSIDPVENHRKREKGVLVYPVYSRRSGGLSVGINLFPDRKVCSFDCPYCEVFPFESKQTFSLSLMETALGETLAEAKERSIPVKDICFSGNGEPSQSPHFPAALEAAFRIRGKAAPEAELVLITNGAGLLDDERFDLLRRSALNGLRIWLKLDAGTSVWYKAMNRSAIPYNDLLERICSFVTCAPVTLQTMICAIGGAGPSPEEVKAWEALAAELAASAAGLREVQIYGKARPAPEDPAASALPEALLEERAASLRAVLASASMGSAGKDIPVLVYP